MALDKVQDIAVFHKSDFLRIIEYSKTIGKWAKNYFLHNFNISHTNNTAITIYQKDNLLICMGLIRYCIVIFVIAIKQKRSIKNIRCVYDVINNIKKR